ncbi:MAG TPA: MBL fold metallo-hydrolase [Chromatiaceae bacterium]|nr:MBL fold metallo-hydrolase [Chromatiaceae bacterium]
MNSSPSRDPVQIDRHTWLIDTRLNRPSHTGCYLLRSGDELAFVDCGASTSVPRLLDALERLGLAAAQVRWILPTHVHLDHAGGAGRLLGHCPDAVLATHYKGLPHMVEPSRLQQGAINVYGEEVFHGTFGELEPVPQDRSLALENGQILPLGDTELLFIETPGHANHHGCFLDQRTGNLFTGDTFGLHYRELDGREDDPFLLATTTPVAFDPDAWFDSLDRMMALQPNRACLTHFGALPEPGRLAARLRESIETHVQIALAEESREVEGRLERLRWALEQAILAQLARHNPLLEPASARELLGIDLELNAQGLSVWLARRARKREKSL